MSRPLAAIRHALHAADLLLSVREPLPETIAAVADDTRGVEPGALFVAVRGSSRDGHAYLAAAARAGAVAAIVEDPEQTTLPALVVRDGRRAAAVAAAAFFGHPAAGLRLLGVTGTNGKTTTVGMLRHLFDAEGSRAASVGTLGVLVGSAGAPLAGGAGLTTPGPVELQRVLRALADAGVRTVAIEVSSHSLDQRRVEGLTVEAAVFTNVSRDHLDYHGTMEAYVAAKARLMEYLGPAGVAVVNADDPAWAVLGSGPRTVRYALNASGAEVSARRVRYTPAGSEWVLRAGGSRARVRLPLIGDFNVANALAAAATAHALGDAVPHVAERLGTVPQIPGRLERIARSPVVLRDYAHTPDALERALRAVRPFVRGRLIVVFGCGGDRDAGKRPEMGRVAAALADLAILTSDNPRTEDPERILDDIETGMAHRAHERIEDRRAAIARAVELARPGDLVLLAGKGHETYQIRGTTALPFDERLVVEELLAAAAHGAAPRPV